MYVGFESPEEREIRERQEAEDREVYLGLAKIIKREIITHPFATLVFSCAIIVAILAFIFHPVFVRDITVMCGTIIGLIGIVILAWRLYIKMLNKWKDS